MWEAAHGANGLCPAGREPRDPHAWLALLDRRVSLPESLRPLAHAAKLMEGDGDKMGLPSSLRHDFARKHEGKGGYFDAVRAAQFILGFLSGGWWEVAVLDAAKRSGLFRDLRWSVECGERGPSGSLEEDIVGLDGAQLVYVSCKRGGQRSRLFPLLEELDARARRMGGRFVRKYLAIYLMPFGGTATALRRRADELDIRLIGPSEVADPSRMASS